MKILHTSDLHLGRSFHGRSLQADQEAICAELVRVCAREQVDAVLIAGDVYDQASPRTEVIQLLSRLLGELNAQGTTVVLTSGNHDSAARLGFGDTILEGAGVHLRTRLADAARPVLLDETTAVYGIPYLDPRAAGPSLGVQPTHAAVLEAVAERIRADLARRPGVRGIVMAHCFAVGAEPTDSERAIESGSLGAVPASVFRGLDYAALGHLHGRQQITPTVRYSGSPLRFSFSETDQVKGYWMLERTEGGIEATPGAWEHQVPLARLRGCLEELLEDPELDWARERMCQITLTDAERPAHPMERLRTRFPHTVELLFDGLRTRPAGSYAQRLARARTPEQVCAEFYEQVRRRPLDEPERRLVEGALDRARDEQAHEAEATDATEGKRA